MLIILIIGATSIYTAPFEEAKVFDELVIKSPSWEEDMVGSG